MADRTCAVDGCDSPHEARGWCNRHYQRWYKWGTPTPVPATPSGPEDERWLPAVGFEDSYEVSDQGRVASIERVVHLIRLGTPITRQMPRKLMKPSVDPTGRQTVKLRRDGEYVLKFVSVLVLETFVGPRPAGFECCHYDDVPANNHLENLRWDTPSANRYDSSRNGTHLFGRRDRCKHGHLYVPPNLKLNTENPKWRLCRACCLARRAVNRAKSRGATVDFNILAAHYYDRIMRSVGPAT